MLPPAVRAGLALALLNVTALCLPVLTTPALAQSNEATLNENINNTGIPRNAPGLSLGQIYGLNPCATGATAGVTTPLFGVAGAISNIDRECEARNNAAVIITALHDETMAREVLCTIKDVREAAARIGKPCLGDGRTAMEASHAVAELMHTPEAPQPPGPQPQLIVPANAPMPPATSPPAPSIATVRADAPAFCHAKDLAVYLYPECTGAARNHETSLSDDQPSKHTAPHRPVVLHQNVVRSETPRIAALAGHHARAVATGPEKVPAAVSPARATSSTLAANGHAAGAPAMCATPVAGCDPALTRENLYNMQLLVIAEMQRRSEAERPRYAAK